MSGGVSRWLSAKEAAELLDLQPKTVVKYIHRGLMRAMRTDRGWRIHEDEVARFSRVRRGPGNPAWGGE